MSKPNPKKFKNIARRTGPGFRKLEALREERRILKASRHGVFEVFDVGDLVLVCPHIHTKKETPPFEAQIASIVVEDSLGELFIRYELYQIPMRVCQSIRHLMNGAGELWVGNHEIIGRFEEGDEK